MLFLYALSIFIATTQCDVVQNMMTYNAMKQPDEYASHHERKPFLHIITILVEFWGD